MSETSEAILPRVLEPEVMDSETEAEDYDAMDHGAVNAAFCDDLLALRPHPTWVLDLGTGTARIPLTLCAKDADVRVVGTDLAKHMLRVAERNVHHAGFSNRVVLREDDAKTPALHDEPFDVVCSNSVVHHIPDPATALRAWWARVPPGALFFVRDLARPDTTEAVRGLVEKYGGTRPSGPAEGASFDRQIELFRASLCAALRVDEVKRIAVSLGIPEGAVARTSDRHFTLAYEKPR
jgi:SAM-dependent methyltransferase